MSLSEEPTDILSNMHQTGHPRLMVNSVKKTPNTYISWISQEQVWKYYSPVFEQDNEQQYKGHVARCKALIKPDWNLQKKYMRYKSSRTKFRQRFTTQVWKMQRSAHGHQHTAYVHLWWTFICNAWWELALLLLEQSQCIWAESTGKLSWTD